MPTGAKLLGALIFCITGALAALAAIPGLPDGRQPGLLVPLSAATGVWFGWSLIGRNVGAKLTQALVLSVRTIAMMILTTLFFIAAAEAYQRSIKLRYDGPVEAVTDVANLMIFFGQMGLQTPVYIVLGIGWVVGAVFVHWAGRVWE